MLTWHFFEFMIARGFEVTDQPAVAFKIVLAFAVLRLS